MKQVETSSLHRGVAGARHSFLPLPGSANKLDVLLQVRLLPLRCSGSGPATVVRMVVLLAPCLLPSLLLSSALLGGSPQKPCPTCLPSLSCRRCCALLPPCPPLQVTQGEHARGKRLMIFCNTLASCRAGADTPARRPPARCPPAPLG
jgi:hypothetical protein